MQKRPEHIPEWAWEQYCEFVGELLLPGAQFPDRAPLSAGQRLEFYERIVKDWRSGPVWRLIGPRKDAGLGSIFNQEGMGQLADGFNHVQVLLENAHMAYMGPSAQDALLKPERKRRAKRMQKAICALLAELSELRALDPESKGLPRELTSEMYGFAHRLASSRIPEYVDDLAAPNAAAYWYTEGFEASTASIQEVLAALGDAVEFWSESKPLIGQPDGPNSKRLYFIRVISSHFEHLYGSPLPEAVEALTSCLYQEAIPKKSVYKLWQR